MPKINTVPPLPLVHQDILCFANDWTADPTSKHQLMRRFAENNRVLWVESAGMRRPNLASRSDLGRIATKLKSMTASATQRTPGLYSYAPPTIPLPGSGLATKVNAASCRLTLRRQLRRLGMSDSPLSWVYAPHVAPWIRGMPRRGLVYHCVDRWGAFADYDARYMEQCEAELCRTADLVLASAEDLAERCRGFGARVEYIPHGVDHQHFASALQPGTLPDDLRNIPEPRIGFFGLIHEWVDLDLVAALADKLPYSFVLLGATNRDLTSLLQRPNVFHLGRKPYAELPDYCRGFSAAIVPFHLSELTRSVNPIKLREYAAAGLPVVASELPEIQRCADIAVCAAGLDGWIAALNKAVAQGGDAAARRRQSDRVRDQDWSRSTERIGDLVEAALSRNGAPARRLSGT